MLKKMDKIDLIVYHDNCPDGFCSAYVAHLNHPNSSALVPASYTNRETAEPDYNKFEGKNVLMVDFSYPKNSLIKLKEVCKNLHVLDHHKTAQADCEGLDFCHFDMTKSGAGLTWEYFHPTIPLPWYVVYVQDRDLWKHELPSSREVSAFINSFPRTISSWNDMLKKYPFTATIEFGRILLNQVDTYVSNIVKNSQPGSFQNHSCMIVNAPYQNISEVGEKLAQLKDVGIGWFERNDGIIQFSLRSKGDIDVSEMAKRYGGGGHKNAAGMNLDIQFGRKLIDSILNRS